MQRLAGPALRAIFGLHLAKRRWGQQLASRGADAASQQERRSASQCGGGRLALAGDHFIVSLTQSRVNFISSHFISRRFR